MEGARTVRLRADAWRAVFDVLGRGRYRVELEGTPRELESVDRQAIHQVAIQVGAELELADIVLNQDVLAIPPFPRADATAELEDLVLAGSWDGVDRGYLLEQCRKLIEQEPADG